MEREPKIHRLKTLQPYFEDIKNRNKNFELRLNDRDYQVGDIVVLEEWTGKQYTGDKVTRTIKYIIKDCKEFGLKDNYCIFNW